MQQEAEAADDYEMAVAGNEEEENNQDAESSLVANDGYCDDDPDPYSDLTNSQQQNNGGMEFNETNEEEKPPQNEENNLNGVEKQQKQRNNYPAAEMVAVNGNANDGGDGLESIPGPVNILYNHHYDVILPPGMKSLHLPIEKKGDEKDEILEFEYHKREGFQDQAFACIRNRQLMIVSAPESAGKTAIAAYKLSIFLNILSKYYINLISII